MRREQRLKHCAAPENARRLSGWRPLRPWRLLRFWQRLAAPPVRFSLSCLCPLQTTWHQAPWPNALTHPLYHHWRWQNLHPSCWLVPPAQQRLKGWQALAPRRQLSPPRRQVQQPGLHQTKKPVLKLLQVLAPRRR